VKIKDSEGNKLTPVKPIMLSKQGSVNYLPKHRNTFCVNFDNRVGNADEYKI